MVVFDQQPMTQSEFKSLKKQKGYLPKQKNTYDPSFWEGYDIVEPNEAIRSFSVKN